MENFIEKQRFIKFWWWLALVPCFFGFIIPFITETKTSEPVNQFAMWVGPVIIICVTLMLFFLTLSSTISSDFIDIKFNILQFKSRRIMWNEIRTVQLEKYNALSEYGGWGYRKGWRRKKQAYNVAGNMGLKIILKDGREVLLGTRQERKMHEYLYYLKTKYQLAALSEVTKP